MKGNKLFKRLHTGLETKWDRHSFFERWFAALTKTMSAVQVAETVPKPGQTETKRPAKMVSRSDLSKTRSPDDIKLLLQDKDICFGNKGFYGTPLPLIPDIRTSDVSEGIVGKLLEAFGVRKKFGRTVTLYQGPNKRSNRYLVIQYNRLIKSIDGSTVKGTEHTPAHVVWTHNFYLASKSSITTAAEHKVLRRKARIFWGIANQLIRNSLAFRIAVIKKSLGKVGRWFHRDFDVHDLFEFNGNYQKIADQFSSKIVLKRKWINQELRDGSYKWRPLGIAPIPWRIYTRGINNMLELFLSGGWPKHQHGYKTGRGIHTAWNEILHTVIKSRFIYEFDFTGFFNTVRIEAVGDVLHAFKVPKYMVGYLVTMSSVDVENISKKDMMKLLHSSDPSQAGWDKAWAKTEYIHGYRRGFRSTGLAQGMALSPILSVLTLIVLDELEAKGIKNVLFADDGLFYSNLDLDFLKIAQELLDSHGIGARFNMSKSISIKANGIWKCKLKFCGLVYDPFTDSLSAATRNGANLKLDIGVVGIFSDSSIPPPSLPTIQETSWLDWISTNDKLFNDYEHIYLISGLGEDYKLKLYDQLSELTYAIMHERVVSHNTFSLADIAVLSEGGVSLTDFLAPIRLLRNIHRNYQYALVDKYNSLIDPFPWDLILSDPYLRELYWMDKGQSVPEFDKVMNAKVAQREAALIDSGEMLVTPNNSPQESLLRPKTSQNKVNIYAASGNVIKHLVYWKSLRSPPASALKHLKGKDFDLATWYRTRLDELDPLVIPSEVKQLLDTSGVARYSRVTWHNLYMDPVFATFIAKLYQNSFRSNVIKQDFRLLHDREVDTLLGLFYKTIGISRMSQLPGCVRLDVFNSSSFMCNLLLRLITSWSPQFSNRKLSRIPPFKVVYQGILKRISHRRSEVDWRTRKGMFLCRGRPTDRSPEFLYPLMPYLNLQHAKHKAIVDLIYQRNRLENGLHIQTITRSSISEHERHTNFTKYSALAGVREGDVESFKSVRWDTFAPKSRKTNISSIPLNYPVINSESSSTVVAPVAAFKQEWTPLKLMLNITRVNSTPSDIRPTISRIPTSSRGFVPLSQHLAQSAANATTPISKYRKFVAV
jgi:hypothetical protein